MLYYANISCLLYKFYAFSSDVSNVAVVVVLAIITSHTFPHFCVLSCFNRVDTAEIENYHTYSSCTVTLPPYLASFISRFFYGQFNLITCCTTSKLNSKFSVAGKPFNEVSTSYCFFFLDETHFFLEQRLLFYTENREFVHWWWCCNAKLLKWNIYLFTINWIRMEI